MGDIEQGDSALQMRYFGSKVSTLNSILNIMPPSIKSGYFCDPFGGIGVVGSFFKSKGFRVYTGDILTFAHYFQASRISLSKTPPFKNLLSSLNLKYNIEIESYLNSLQPTYGWFTKEYSSDRMFFTKDNAGRIHSCMDTIHSWNVLQLLNDLEYKLLIASLINSADKVANTAGTYYAYLKQFNRRSLKRFDFSLINPEPGLSGCKSFLDDAQVVATKRHYDVLYLDPPYNERNYSRYYHLPETMALGQKPQLSGKSGMPQRPFPVTRFNSPSLAEKAFQDIINKASFNFLIFHYSGEGLIPHEMIMSLLSPLGESEVVEISGKGYTNKSTSRSTKHLLYVVKNA